MLARDRRNQKTLNSIRNPEVKLTASLRRLSKDITDNILQQHRFSCKNQQKKHITLDELKQCDENFEKMNKRIDEIEQ